MSKHLADLVKKVWSGCYLQCDPSELYKAITAHFPTQLNRQRQVTEKSIIFSLFNFRGEGRMRYFYFYTLYLLKMFYRKLFLLGRVTVLLIVLVFSA